MRSIPRLWIERSELLAKAHDRGAAVSDSQLKRLRREGLLQRPIEHHPPGRRGLQTWYPPEAVDQLVAVIELGQEERRFRERRFIAWERGLYVQREMLRRTLKDLINEGTASFRGRRVPRNQDSAARWARRAVKSPHRSPVSATLRRRTLGDTSDFADVIYLVLLVATGQRELDPRTDLVRRAIGFDKAESDAHRYTGVSIVDEPPDAEQLLDPHDIAGHGGIAKLASIITRATAAELRQARDDLAVWASDWPDVAQAAALDGNHDLLGLGLLRTLTGSDRRALLGRASLVPALIMLRRSADSRTLDSTYDTIREVAPLARQVMAL